MRKGERKLRALLRDYIDTRKQECRKVGPLGSEEHPFQRGQLFELEQLENFLQSMPIRSMEELLELTKNDPNWWFSDSLTDEEVWRVREYLRQQAYDVYPEPAEVEAVPEMLSPLDTNGFPSQAKGSKIEDE